MKIITVASLKGGVGKTTTAINLANALLRRGKKVLVCDFDPNNNLTDYFCRDMSDQKLLEANAYHFMTNRKSVGSCIHQSKSGVAVMPATVTLHSAGVEMANDPMSLISLRDGLRSLGRLYDVCIIDTAPSMAYTTRAGIYAADKVVVPINYSRWSVQAVQILEHEVILASNRMSKLTKERITINVLPSCVSAAENESIRNVKQFAFTKTTIPRKAVFRSAVDRGVELKAGSEPSDLFLKLSKEFV